MKYITILILTTILVLSNSVVKVFSQVIVVGHISAEVIESVSVLTYQTANNELYAINPGDSRVLDQPSLNVNTIDLGSFTIKSASDISCNVVVESTSFSGTSRNSYDLQTTVACPSSEIVEQLNGSQTIQPNGKANFSDIQNSGLNHEIYKVVFAFN
jgi:hypothetical protein